MGGAIQSFPGPKENLLDCTPIRPSAFSGRGYRNGAYGANDVAYVRTSRGRVGKCAVCRNVVCREVTLAGERRVGGGLRSGPRRPAGLVCAVAADSDDGARPGPGRRLWSPRVQCERACSIATSTVRNSARNAPHRVSCKVSSSNGGAHRHTEALWRREEEEDGGCRHADMQTYKHTEALWRSSSNDA